MSDEEARRNEMARKTIVLSVPGMEEASVRQGLPYAGDLTLDVYAPPGMQPGERRPAVVFVFGFANPAFRKLKDTGGYVSWARLVAASGLVAVTYECADPVADGAAVLAHVREHAASLGIDAQRLAVWAASGNVPAALTMLMREPRDAFRCAALLYGFMLDEGESTSVASAAGAYGFVPATGRSVDDLPGELPLFVARAGKDYPELNRVLDGFVARALARNLPLTLSNHATGPHSFDLLDDSETSREIIRAIVAFLRFHLTR